MKILGAILAVFVLYCIIAILVVDNKQHFEKTVVINAPKEKVWSQVNSMKAFNNWNPWMKLDPKLTVTYDGVSGEVGDSYHWKGDSNVGEGKQEITAIIPNEKMATKMTFISEGNDVATSDLLLANEGSGTKVTWTIDYEIETIRKPMQPLMNYFMGKAYEEGLAKLKEISEK